MVGLSEDRFKPRKSSLVPPLSETSVATLLLVADSIAILGSGYFLYDTLVIYSLAQNLYFSAIAFVWLLGLALMNFGGLYRYDTATVPFKSAHVAVIVMATAFLFLLAAAYSIKVSETFSRIWLASFALGSTISLVGMRVAFSIVLTRLQGIAGTKRNLAVIGDGEQISQFLHAIETNPRYPVRICGIYSEQSVLETDTSKGEVPSWEAGKLLRETRHGFVDDVVIALPWSEVERISKLLDRLREIPVHIYLATDLIGFRFGFRAPPSHYGSLPLVQLVGKPISGWDSALKLIEDYVLGLFAIIILSPIMGAIALSIILDSPGPVIFRQKRLGFNNKVFDVFKFRSMRHGPDTHGATKQAVRGDDRITRVGKFLRRWSFDELPQLFNVLNGTMSLVGPRPHALDHNEEFARRMEGYFSRHRVKPGITGLAQVRGFRGATDTKAKLEGRIRNDIFYAENWSPTLDLQILLRTLVICILGKNAY